MKYFAFMISLLLVMLAPLTSDAGIAEQYNISYLNMGSGMPNNYVDDIYQDSKGFMWISTHGGGLVRYDGYSFLDYSLGGNIGFGLLSNSCLNVTEDKFNRLWIAFEEGVQVMDLRTGQTDEVKAVNDAVQKQLDRVISEPCKRVYCDSKGCIWILKVGRIDHIAFDNDGKVLSVLSASHNTKAADLAIADLNHDGSVFVGLNFHMNRVSVAGSRVHIEDLSSRYPYLNGLVIGSIIEWRGKIWFGTSNGLYNSDRGNTGWHANGTPQGIQHETVTSLAVTTSGRNLLIGTLSGVDIMDSSFKIAYHLNTTSYPISLSSNFVNNILVSDERIWIGTESGGITRIVPRLLSLDNYAHIDGDMSSISAGPVNAMYAAPNGDLFVGTVEGGLNFKRAGSNAFEHFTTGNSGLTHNSVSALTSDVYGNLWIGTWGGGVCYVPIMPGAGLVPSRNNIIPLTVDAKYSSDLQYVGALAYDPYNKGLWIGANAGLFFYDFRTKKVIDPFPSNRSINGAIGIIVTRDGKLLMGCLPGMVCIDLKRGRDSKGHFSYTHYLYKLDNPGTKAFDKITCFFQTKDGTLWIGSNGYGMYRVTGNISDTTKIKSFTTNDGLSNNSVKGIVEGKNGMLWVATENGLSRFNPKTQAFSNFTTADGLLSNQFYFNGAVVGRNALYLGSDRGLTVLNGVDMRSMKPGVLHFTGLFVNNQWANAGSKYIKESITDAETIHLHEEDRNISIEFSAFSYGGETQGVYSYRLKGYEEEWTKLQPGQHGVSYTSLPGGHYKLEVRYASSLDDSKLQTASIKVVVTPYFYKSWWFVLIVVLVLIIIATYLYNRRVEQVRNHETELLYRPIEAAIKDSPDPDKLQERIQTILRNQERYRESQIKTVEEDKSEMAKEEKNTEPVMERVMSVLEKCYADPSLNVQMLADKVGMSRSELHKALQTEVGMGTTQFIRDYRLDVARRFLEDNVADRNITEIAYRVGFNDPKYFTRCFTQKFGTAPSAYKK